MTPSKMEIMAHTMINSISVNPLCCRLLLYGPIIDIYQSLYFWPFNAVPVDFEYTSNTFCPPHESDWGSSCMERKPQSLLPVMGSSGIRRKNRTFLPPAISTPLT